jgi:hypothetical protein
MVSRVLWDFRVLPVQQGLKVWSEPEPRDPQDPPVAEEAELRATKA